MVNNRDLEEIKKYIGPDGKLIISDDLSEAKKERFRFINEMNIDLMEILTRKPVEPDDDDDDEMDEDLVDFVPSGDDDDDDYSDDEGDDSYTEDSSDDYSIDLESTEETTELLDDLDDMF